MTSREPVTGGKGQQLCDGYRPCQLGYHCGPCHKAWLERAISRSQMKAHRNRERRRKGLPQ